MGTSTVFYEPSTADAVNTTVATTIFTTFNVTTAVPENNSNLNKHKDFNPKELCTNRTPYVTQDSTNQIYENVPIPRRDDAIYENSPESEDFYETRLPAI
ncbi:uncharacterized protein LOC143930232 isoform X3 [Lithobates pipiens]